MSRPLVPELHVLSDPAFYRDKVVSKGELLAIKFNEDNKISRKVYLRMEDRIIAPFPEPITIFDSPWDIVFIMTKSWLLVVRPQLQETPERAEEQVRGIRKRAEEMLQDSRRESKPIDTMYCWMLVPSYNQAIARDKSRSVLTDSQRKDIYKRVFDEGMKELIFLKNGVFIDQYYCLKPFELPNESFIWLSKVVIHDAGSGADMLYGSSLVKKFPDLGHSEQL